MSLSPGVICMFSGATIPDGWLLCDGKNNTPNLVDKFIYGTGLDNINNTNNVKGTGAYNNKVFVAESSSVSISASVTVSDHTLSVDQIPSHSHQVKTKANRTVGIDNSKYSDRGNYWLAACAEFTGDPLEAKATGGSRGHNHQASISSQSPHYHTTNVSVPYYTLAFIKYVGI